MFNFFGKFKKEVTDTFNFLHDRIIALEDKVESLYKTEAPAPVEEPKVAEEAPAAVVEEDAKQE